MTADQFSDERLRNAFQSLGDRTGSDCSEADLERIWRAVTGDLPAAERRELVERMAVDPACAQAWRVAQELWRASQAESRAELHDRRPWIPVWLAAAAIVLIGVAVGLVQFNRPAEDVFRDQPRYAVESLVPSDTTLPRDAFRLRWKAEPEGSRYKVRVTTEDLRLLATANDLTVPELLIPPDQLASIPPGARILWQIDVALPDGVNVSSQTFVVRVQK